MATRKNYIPLTNDLVFKYVFGTEENKRFTIDLISEILNFKGEELKDAKITNSIKLNKKNVESKSFEVDVLVETKSGKTYNLEMQTIFNINSVVKNLTYLMSLFVSQFKRGDAYENIVPIIQINIIKQNQVFKESDLVRDEFGIASLKSKHTILDEYFKVLIIDLGSKDVYTKINDKLKGWLMLLNARNIEEARECVKYNSRVEEVIEVMSRFIDKDYVQNYEREEMLHRSNIRLSREEGKKEGLKAGRDEGLKEGRNAEKYDTARKMLLNNKSPEEIYLYTDIPVEKLTKLKLELKEESVLYNQNNVKHNKITNH